MPLAGSSRCPTPSAMRATDRWAIEERGIPSLELMERAGAGLAAAGRARSRRDGPDRGRLRQGQQRRRRLVAARLLRERGPRGPRADCSRDPASCAATRAANLERLPGAPPEPFAAAALDGARGDRRRDARHRLLRRAARPAPRRDRGDQRARGAPVVAADVPSGRRRLDRRGRRRGGPRDRDRDLPRRQAGPVDRTRARRTPARCDVVDIGIPRRRARSTPRRRPDRRRGRSTRSRAASASSTKFTSGHVLVARRLARA